MDETSDKRYKVIFVIGPPGAGKNTQCDEIIKNFGFIHFGAGDLLRAESKKDTDEGVFIRETMNQGKIVPTRITCGLIKKKMDEYGRQNIFLIDGYPRNLENLERFLEVFGDQLELICTLHLFCDEQTCVQRLINRGQNSGRADDAEEIIKKRFNVFYNESIPVVESLKKITKMIEIDSTQSAEIVTENILRDVQEIIKK